MTSSSSIKLDLQHRDQVFVENAPIIGDFTFNAKVAEVFDDMVSRSVPFYGEMQRLVCELAKDFAKPGSNLYDVGCSTATTLLAMDEGVHPEVKFIGIDNAPDMVNKAKQKVADSQTKRDFEFIVADLHREVPVHNASLVSMVLTLQFIRPLHPERIMRAINDGMNEGGCLLLVEKITSEDTIFNRLFIQHYYDFKRRNGYTDIEIAKKREALENVLIPYRLEENIQLLQETGFKHAGVFFCWYNFCGIIAIK